MGVDSYLSINLNLREGTHSKQRLAWAMNIQAVTDIRRRAKCADVEVDE